MSPPFSQARKYAIRFLGVIVYYLFLILNLTFTVAFKLSWGILNPIDPLRIIIIFFLCAIPVVPSSFVVSYLNFFNVEKDHYLVEIRL
jgi:hypothetical protein